MSTYDVRNMPTGVITEIRFAERNNNRYSADVVVQNHDVLGIEIKDSCAMERYLEVRDAAHADNLIKALEKAKELGWLK